MRRVFLGVAAALAVVALVPTGRAYAQIGNIGSDPFTFYYGYYLPHQAAIAAQPTPMDTINQNIARRQQAAMTDRASLYDPASPYGEADDDPLAPYSGSGRRGATNRPKQGFGISQGRDNTRGHGPALYYNRTARYFADLRTGRGPNRNLANVRSARGGGGGGAAMGMTGPMTPSAGLR